MSTNYAEQKQAIHMSIMLILSSDPHDKAAEFTALKYLFGELASIENCIQFEKNLKDAEVVKNDTV